MKKTSINLLAFTALFVLLSAMGCKKEDAKPTDVYVAGSVYTASGIYTATYWKNGTAVNLNNGTNTAKALDIQVSDNDVYVCGYELNGMITVAKYWKNGTAVTLSDGTHTANALSIHVSSNDVYVCGYEIIGVITVAKYWKKMG